MNANGKHPEGTPPSLPPTIKTSGPIKIDGVAEAAQKFPDDGWYEMRLHIRKIEGGAEVRVFPTWQRVP